MKPLAPEMDKFTPNQRCNQSPSGDFSVASYADDHPDHTKRHLRTPACGVTDVPVHGTVQVIPKHLCL